MTSPYTRSHSVTNATIAANAASPRATIATVNMKCSSWKMRSSHHHAAGCGKKALKSP
jgi:hypothetical protein